jgi:hypothetical protein
MGRPVDATAAVAGLDPARGLCREERPRRRVSQASRHAPLPDVYLRSRRTTQMAYPHYGESEHPRWGAEERDREWERERRERDRWRASEPGPGSHDRPWRGGDDWRQQEGWSGREADWRDRERSYGRGYEGGERTYGGSERDRQEVMEGGDRGWPGGVRGAEGGGGYGRGFFGTAYSLYAGRPEHEQRGRFERLGHTMGEDPRRRMGRGPKGYRRSDERVHEDVCERIARSGVNADDVEVRVENGQVTLSGTVSSRDEKRYLEDLCEDVFGVDEVHNQIRVSRGESSTSTQPGIH